LGVTRGEVRVPEADLLALWDSSVRLERRDEDTGRSKYPPAIFVKAFLYPTDGLRRDTGVSVLPLGFLLVFSQVVHPPSPFSFFNSDVLLLLLN
jgi:hypothetical protein